MFTLKIDDVDFFDEKTERFFTIKGQTLQLEHSLVAISKWEAKYKKMRLRQPKNAALFLIALGLYRQGQYRKALERMRFIRKKDPALDHDAVNALFFALLTAIGNEEAAVSFYKKNAESVDLGKKSIWMDNK